jgi:hypothetical protein
VSHAQFDHYYRRGWTGVDTSIMPALDLDQPRGGAAMLDAIWMLSSDTARRLRGIAEHLRPGAVIIGIVSVSLDNTSRVAVALTQMVNQMIARRRMAVTDVAPSAPTPHGRVMFTMSVLCLCYV